MTQEYVNKFRIVTKLLNFLDLLLKDGTIWMMDSDHNHIDPFLERMGIEKEV